jgi:hypothetical protein
MYQKDYILRMIEMMGELIAGLLGLIKKGEFQQAQQSIENAYYGFLQQDASLLQHIPVEKLTDTLLQEHHYTHGHLEILAELFFAQSELLHAQGKAKESMSFYEKSLVLTSFTLTASKAWSAEKQERMQYLRSQLGISEDAGPN